jgi:hypothetical protein
MIYYINNKKLGAKPLFFKTIPELVAKLQAECLKLTGRNRPQFMLNRVDLGHPADEATGQTFIEAMSETVDIGLVRENTLIRCNIFEAAHHAKYTAEMGD